MGFRRVWTSVVAAGLLGWCGGSQAQGPKPRLAAAIGSTGQRQVLPGSRPALASRGVDKGALPDSTQFKGITLVFNRSAAQQSSLDTLLAAQQDPSSPQFHHWLTPDQFASRFGMADADIASVTTWLQSQGFVVDGVARSRDRISFDGTAGQVASAFGTQLHRYSYGSETHFAPNSDLSLPAVLAPLVTTVIHLSDFRAHAYTKVMPRPAYTSSQSQNDFLTPGDLATMYNVSPVYQAGYNGTGQAIAILGESYIDTAPVTQFQSALGLTVNTPNLVLVPDTGVPGVDPMGDGDEGESQLDVEYASGMAPGAQVYLVYTGDSPNSSGVFDSLSYAVSEDIAPVISGSYGVCETAIQSQGVSTANSIMTFYNNLVQEANAQGQTVIFASGDEGSTSCFNYGSLSAAQQEALSASFPATIPGITALGGLQMQTGTFYKQGLATGSSSQYWQSATGTDVLSSLLSYVPETVWNEDNANSSSPILSGGGGSSVLYSRPSWQAGVAGIPTGTSRLIPDISLQASTSSPGYLYCTSDPGTLNSEGITSTCTNGLRGPTGIFQEAGGTSFAAPVFAGMLAVLNQAKAAVGQGNANTVLYGLAANSTTYASVFHDTTTGTNACTAGTAYCSTAGASQYGATAGFDEATGLGSFDFAKLVAAWPSATGASASAASSTTTLTAATLTPASGAGDAITISVSGSAAGSVVPSGTVSLAVDGSATPVVVTLVNGQASYTYPGTTDTGSHAIVAAYSGDTNFLPSRSTLVLTLAGSTTVAGSFTLAASNITVAANSTANGTISVTPSAGYSGTLLFSLAVSTGSHTVCYSTSSASTGASNLTVAGGGIGAVTATLSISQGTPCGSAAAVMPKQPGVTREPRWPEGIAFAGLLCVGFAVRRSRRLPALLSIAVLGLLGLGLSGCGNNTATTTTLPIGTTQNYTATLTAVDTVNSSITGSTTFTLTLQ